MLEYNDRMFEIGDQDCKWGSLKALHPSQWPESLDQQKVVMTQPTMPEQWVNSSSWKMCVSSWRAIRASFVDPKHLMWKSICILFGGACSSSWLSVLPVGGQAVGQEVSMSWGGCECGGDECCSESDNRHQGEKWPRSAEISHEDEWPVHRMWVEKFL